MKTSKNSVDTYRNAIYVLFHVPVRRSGIKQGDPFGPKYFKVWWDKACKNLGIRDVGLYGGTKHTVATALGSILTPEEIKRGGTGSRTEVSEIITDFGREPLTGVGLAICRV